MRSERAGLSEGGWKLKDRIILDLCGGTGSWSKPYVEAGYDVRLVTMPEQDVRLFKYPGRVHGVLAAPPCTMFCRMRMCHGRPTDDQFKEALSVVDACLRIITMVKPEWWALENPQGYLKIWLGNPRFKFDPYEYGDAWTKRTWIWGNFVVPIFNNPVKPTGALVKKHGSGKHWRDGVITKQTNIARNQVEAATTPPGFAQAFFEANP